MAWVSPTPSRAQGTAAATSAEAAIVGHDRSPPVNPMHSSRVKKRGLNKYNEFDGRVSTTFRFGYGFLVDFVLVRRRTRQVRQQFHGVENAQRGPARCSRHLQGKVQHGFSPLPGRMGIHVRRQRPGTGGMRQTGSHRLPFHELSGAISSSAAPRKATPMIQGTWSVTTWLDPWNAVPLQRRVHPHHGGRQSNGSSATPNHHSRISEPWMRTMTRCRRTKSSQPTTTSLSPGSRWRAETFSTMTRSRCFTSARNDDATSSPTKDKHPTAKSKTRAHISPRTSSTPGPSTPIMRAPTGDSKRSTATDPWLVGTRIRLAVDLEPLPRSRRSHVSRRKRFRSIGLVHHRRNARLQPS